MRLSLIHILDLAGQPRIRPHVVTEVEHVFFHRRRFAGLFAPGLIDIDVTGRTGAGPAAFGFDVRPNSRLSCQIKVSDELDGLLVTTPEKQG